MGVEYLSLTANTVVYMSISFSLFVFVVRNSRSTTTTGLFLRIYFLLVVAPFSILVTTYLKNDFFLQIEAYIVVLTPLLVAKFVEYFPILLVKRIDLRFCAGTIGSWVVLLSGLGMVAYLFLNHLK